MIKSASFVVCCLLTFYGLNLQRQAQSDCSHDKWLQEKYFEATSIKEGMTRADLMKVFRMDGGLQPILPTRYVLKGSDFIKVDVEFDVPEDAKGKIVPEDLRDEMESPALDSNGKPVTKQKYQIVPNEQLKIKRISKPYLEQFAYD